MISTNEALPNKLTNKKICFSPQEVHVPRLITPAEKGKDLEPRVMDAYIIQSQAEAQEGSSKTPDTFYQKDFISRQWKL